VLRTRPQASSKYLHGSSRQRTAKDRADARSNAHYRLLGWTDRPFDLALLDKDPASWNRVSGSVLVALKSIPGTPAVTVPNPSLGAGLGLAATFAHLAEVWRDATMFSSSPTEIATHWAYQRIIGLGPEVVPLIFRDLQDGGSHWHWALSALTGENPALDTTSPGEASERWLDWGREQHIVNDDDAS